MEVIALKGPANKGKSQSINILYQYLLLFGYVQIPGYFRTLGNPLQRDFIDIVEKRGVKVGIFSMGDYARGADTVKKLLKILDHAGCATAVCACTIKPGTIKAVTAYKKHIFVNKSIASVLSDERIVNGDDAEVLYKLI